MAEDDNGSSDRTAPDAKARALKLSVSNAGKIAGGVAAVAMVFGVVALASRGTEPPKAAGKTVAATTRKLELPDEQPRFMSVNPVVQSQAPSRPAPPAEPAKPKELTDYEKGMQASQQAPMLAFSKPFASKARTEEPLHAVSRETEDKGAFERRFTPSSFEATRAGVLQNRRFHVTAGTEIPCVLETAMQSDQPGFVTCVITRDVWGDTAEVVLMEKGTQVMGEYRGGLQPGQARLNVIWSRAKTPGGVVAQLGSAATDALGRSGIGGEIDTHFWERMSSALVLSLVQDISQIGAARLQQSQGVQSSGAGQAGNQAAAIAVEQSAAIKPTLRKNQGEMVMIMLARDVDFSSVYAIKNVRNTGAWQNYRLLEPQVMK